MKHGKSVNKNKENVNINCNPLVYYAPQFFRKEIEKKKHEMYFLCQYKQFEVRLMRVYEHCSMRPITWLYNINVTLFVGRAIYPPAQ